MFLNGEHRHRRDTKRDPERWEDAEDEDRVHSGAVFEVGADAGEIVEGWHERGEVQFLPWIA